MKRNMRRVDVPARAGVNMEALDEYREQYPDWAIVMRKGDNEIIGIRRNWESLVRFLRRIAANTNPAKKKKGAKKRRGVKRGKKVASEKNWNYARSKLVIGFGKNFRAHPELYDAVHNKLSVCGPFMVVYQEDLRGLVEEKCPRSMVAFNATTGLPVFHTGSRVVMSLFRQIYDPRTHLGIIGNPPKKPGVRESVEIWEGRALIYNLPSAS